MSPTGSMHDPLAALSITDRKSWPWQSLFYKLQELRMRFLRPRTPIVLFSNKLSFLFASGPTPAITPCFSKSLFTSNIAAWLTSPM